MTGFRFLLWTCSLAACVLVAPLAAPLDAYGHDGRPTKLVLQLCWDHQFQFAGYYAAQIQGYYEEAGLDVEIRGAFNQEGRFTSASKEVAEGRADFGVGAANILSELDKGTPLVILASIFQHSAVEFYAKQESGTLTPERLARMKILRRKGDLGEVEMQAMFRAEGIDPKNIEFYPLRRDKPSAQCLEDGDVDAILGFSLTSPYLLSQQGLPYSKLRPAMYGIDFYGDSLFASNAFVKAHEDLTDRFIKASLKGWAYALTHSDEMIEHISSFYERTFPPRDDDVTFNRFQRDGVMVLTNYPHEELGHINPDRWRKMGEYLRKAGVVRGEIDFERAIYDPIRWKHAEDEIFHKTLYGTLGVTCFLGVLVFFWGISLRKVVGLRTGELVRANFQLRNEIEERCRVEAELRESEQRFRQLVENIREIFWVQDVATGEVLYVSADHVKIWGRPRTGFYCRPEEYFQWVCEEDLMHVRDRVKSRAEGQELDVEYRLEQADGSFRWLRDRLFPILNAEGEEYRLAGISEDITIRKEADIRLKRSEERLRLLVDYLPVMIHAQDEAGRYLFWNKESERVTGYTSARMVDSDEALALLYPDAEYREAVRRKRHDAAAGTSTWEDEVHCADGGTKTIAWTDLSNQCIIPGWAIWEVGLDFTELRGAERALRESEARYRTITENLPVGVLLMDKDLRVVAANSTIREWFWNGQRAEMPRCYNLIGREGQCEDCPCVILRDYQRVYTSFKDLIVQGQKRKFKVTACLTSESADAQDRYMAIYTDITEDVELSEKLQLAKKTELVATMGSGIAHEVSQPLNALTLWITGLLMRLDQDDMIATSLLREQLGKIHQAADRIADVIEHMRILIRRGDEVVLEPTDLNEVVERAMSLLSAKITVHGILLKKEMLETPPVVEANLIQMEQVVINLVTNAIDAHDTWEGKGKTITITTLSEADSARIVIEDNGPGFDGNEERIFDPFFTTKEAGVGMGLGLTLVQTIVNSLGGKVYAMKPDTPSGAKMVVELRRTNASCSI